MRLSNERNFLLVFLVYFSNYTLFFLFEFFFNLKNVRVRLVWVSSNNALTRHSSHLIVKQDCFDIYFKKIDGTTSYLDSMGL